MQKLQDFLIEYQERIIEVYRSYHLYSVRGIDESPDAETFVIFKDFYQIIQANRLASRRPIPYRSMQLEIMFCSDEILYFLANLFLYLPYLNDPIQDAVALGTKNIYPNYQTPLSKKYNMFANIVAEKLYNFWDRLGDLIATFFPEIHEGKNIFFGKVISKIPSRFHNSDNYQWLFNFSKNEYLELNNKRIDIVHYFGVDSLEREKHLEIASDREEIIEWQQKRKSLPIFYKEHLNLSIIGYQKTLCLLREISLLKYGR